MIKLREGQRRAVERAVSDAEERSAAALESQRQQYEQLLAQERQRAQHRQNAHE